QFSPTNAGAPQGVPIQCTVIATDTSGQPFAGRTLRFSILGVNPQDGMLTLDATRTGVIVDPGTNANTVVGLRRLQRRWHAPGSRSAAGTGSPLDRQREAFVVAADEAAQAADSRKSVIRSSLGAMPFFCRTMPALPR